jgi:hypothetical protein
MFPLTNKNVRIRYIVEKANKKLEGKKFTYNDMAEKFDSDDRTIYTWVSTRVKTQHLPTSESKRKKLLEWINDGKIEQFHRSKR